ncbi:MAG: Lipid-binding protein, partial [Geminicoccaceae bacterium]|nr:Lipid-binding protein [Geminicoccaceae bacterium]
MRVGRLAAMVLFLSLGIGLAPRPAAAASALEIDAEVVAALTRFDQEVPAGWALLAKAKGVLVFPKVIKAGFGIGGEYGEGALRIGGRSVGYYNTVSASIGLQLGAQSRAELILFMTDEALAAFRASDGWEVGVDGSVALVSIGVAGEIDTTTINDPVIGFIFGEQGLMANLSLEGAKISRLEK